MEQKTRNILLVVTRGTVGGAQAVVLNLAKGLHEAGEKVTVAFGDGDYLETECTKAGIRTHRLTALRRSMNPFKNLSALWEMKRYFDSEQYDIIHMHSSNALVATLSAKLSRAKPKTVFTVHGLSFLDEGVDISSMVRIVYTHVMRTLLRFVDNVVFVSNTNAEAAKKMRLTKTTTTVIHNGLRTDELHFLDRTTARRKLAQLAEVEILESAFLIGSIGRLDMAKNYEFLIQQVALLQSENPSIQACVIGEGPLRSKLEQYIRAQKVRNRFTLVGEMPLAASFLKAFDLFVLPSRYEGFSIAILEALSAGIPILASDVGGAREQLPYTDLQVYPAGDQGAFQERLKFLMNNESERSKLAEANQERSLTFHIGATTKAYRRLYYANVTKMPSH